MMRRFGWLGALACILAAVAPAAAQSALEGPLAAPDATPVAKSKPKSAKHSKKKLAHHDATRHDTGQPVDAYEAAPGAPQPVVHSGRAAPADPLSVGMKWNGNNDDARETRVQNYNGGASGTGAEVGLKLHF